MKIDYNDNTLIYHSSELKDPKNIKLINEFYKKTDSIKRLCLEDNKLYVVIGEKRFLRLTF